jgi:2-oxo-4-hydroxy-4-carboxy--5-ureidoimidazoline (OHCU) decarboxylase
MQAKDSLPDEGRQTLLQMTQAQVEKFGFPSIIAVKRLNNLENLTVFQPPINND